MVHNKVRYDIVLLYWLFLVDIIGSFVTVNKCTSSSRLDSNDTSIIGAYISLLFVCITT